MTTAEVWRFPSAPTWRTTGHASNARVRSRWLYLAWAGLYALLLGCFGGLALLYLQAPADLPQPPFWAPRPHHSAEVATLYRGALGLPILPLTAAQFAAAHQGLLAGTLTSATALLALSLRVLPRRALWPGALGLATVALLMPPLYATDVFYYGITGEMAARGANPYLLTPSAFPESRLLPFNFWLDIPSPYGPVWTTACALIAGLGAFDPFRVTILFKLLGVAAVLGSAWLLGRYLPPATSAFPLALLLLNPVVWLEAVANAHLDALMLWPAAGAALLLARGRPRLAWVCLLLALWVKYLTAPLLAFHAAARIQRANRTIGARLRVLGSCCSTGWRCRSSSGCRTGRGPRHWPAWPPKRAAPPPARCPRSPSRSWRGWAWRTRSAASCSPGPSWSARWPGWGCAWASWCGSGGGRAGRTWTTSCARGAWRCWCCRSRCPAPTPGTCSCRSACCRSPGSAPPGLC